MPSDLIDRVAIPPREMRRTTPFALANADDDDGLTLDGYAAVFNRRTIIDSWEGRFWEQIAPGAMKKSFRENPPKVQFDHGHHPLIGSIPIGSPLTGFPREEVDATLAPEGGAHVVARLHDNWLVQPVRDAISSEAINGMSFRFGVVTEVWHDSDGKQIRDEEELYQLLRRSWLEDIPDDELLLRTLKEVRVPELGPVVWPAYAETSVGVRARTIDLGHLDDPETKSFLARALLLADSAKQDDNAPESTRRAALHAEPSTDRPQTTETSAGEHPSAAARRRRDRMQRDARNTAGYFIRTQSRKD
ncbi:HK97 family phage prohead protease [Micropruina sp.]|uniref:HK97 family phage prohead protease n=1 Tax=Micropruina sp. TaxID=2737536 RepID=UPI0039E4F049